MTYRGDSRSCTSNISSIWVFATPAAAIVQLFQLRISCSDVGSAREVYKHWLSKQTIRCWLLATTAVDCHPMAGNQIDAQQTGLVIPLFLVCLSHLVPTVRCSFVKDPVSA
jgi:hypothetical protein